MSPHTSGGRGGGLQQNFSRQFPPGTDNIRYLSPNGENFRHLPSEPDQNQSTSPEAEPGFPGVDPTRHTSPGVDSTRHTAPGVDPTRHTSSGVDPTRYTSPGVDSTRHISAGVDPTLHTSHGVDPTRHTSAGVDPTRHTSPGVDSTRQPSPGQARGGTVSPMSRTPSDSRGAGWGRGSRVSPADDLSDNTSLSLRLSYNTRFAPVNIGTMASSIFENEKMTQFCIENKVLRLLNFFSRYCSNINIWTI